MQALTREPAQQPGSSVPAARPAPLDSIGARAVSTDPRPATVLDADRLKWLGSVNGRSWFGRDDREIRIDQPVPELAIGDSLPPHRVIVRAMRRVPDRTEELPGPTPYSPTTKKLVRGGPVEIFYRATIMDAGSFATAQRRDRPRRGPVTVPRQPSRPVSTGAATKDNPAFWAERRAGSRPQRAEDR